MRTSKRARGPMDKEPMRPQRNIAGGGEPPRQALSLVSWLGGWLTLTLIAICALGSMLAMAMPLTDDVSWYIAAVSQWAEGQQLYREIGDINTPGIYYLHLLALQLSQLFDVGDHIGLIALFSASTLIFALWSESLLRRDETLAPPVRLAFVLGFAVLVYLIALLDFGQREHWAFVFFLPQVLCLHLIAVGRPANPLSRHAAACLAALTLTLKPHFLLAYLLLEAGLAWKRRRFLSLFRSENLMAGGLVALCYCVFYLLHPAYFSDILPRALQLYGAFSFGWFAGYGNKVILLVSLAICLGLAVTATALLRQERLRSLAFFLLLAAAAFALLFILQQKGWPYQFLPAYGFALLAAIVLCCAALWRLLCALWTRDLSALFSSGGGGLLLIACVMAALPAAALYKAADQLLHQRAYPASVQALRALLEKAGPDAPRVFALSTAISPSFPAVTLTQATWVGRQPSLWEFPAYYDLYRPRDVPIPYRPPAEQSVFERESFETILSIFEREKPDVVLVYVSAERPPFGRYFDFLVYLSQDPRFRALWDGYALAGSFANHEVYTRRKDE